MRITIGMIVEALAAGRTVENLLSDFPYLEDRDIREAVAYAANLAGLRAAIDEGDANGISQGDPFARVRETLNLPARR